MAPPQKKLTPQQMGSLQRRLAVLQPAQDEQLAGNEGEANIDSGIFGEIFDKLSRTSAASAGAAFALSDKDSSTGVGRGALEGLLGRTHHNYGEVLGNVGVKNPVLRGIGGFVGDVALDPLTYVGAKGEKGIRPKSAAIMGAQEALGSGAAFTNVAEAAAERILQENPSTIHFSFAGKRVTPKFKTPSRVGNALRDIVAGPEMERNALAKGLSRESELAGGLNTITRDQEILSAAEFEGHQKAFDAISDDLTPEQSKRVMYALESGENLSAVPLELSKGQTSMNGFTNLEDYKNFARKTLDGYHAEDVSLGLKTPKDYIENYVPKYLEKPPAPRYPGARAASKNKQGGIKDVTKEMSLQELEDAGYQPNYNLGDVLRNRAAASYRHNMRAKIVQKPILEMGLRMTDETAPFIAKNQWISVAENIENPIGRSEALAGHYMPEPIVRMLNATEDIVTDDSTGNQFMRFYDKSIMHPWKVLATGTPGFIARAGVGDAIMNFADGVRTPAPYAKAAKVLQGAAENHTKSVVDEILGRTGTTSARGGASSRMIKMGKEMIPVSKVYEKSLRVGVDTGQITAISREMTPNAQAGLGHFRDRADRALEVAKNPLASAKDTASTLARKWMEVNRGREKYFRLAHVIDKADKLMSGKKGMSFDAAMEQAGKDTRHFNIDYGNLSSVEQKYMKRVAPFYTWFRRNVPVQVELMATKPGFMALYPKGQDLMQTVLGTNDGSDDFMSPQWMRRLGPVRLAMANNEGNVLNRLARKLSGAGPNDAVFAPLLSGSTPIGDLNTISQPYQAFKDASNPVTGAWDAVRGVGKIGVGMATPVIKDPIEMASGRSLYNGQEVTDWQSWGLNQLGAGGRVADMTQNGVNPGSALSMGTGLQVQANTAKRQRGEFMRREDILRAQILHAKTQRLQMMGKPVTEDNLKRVRTRRTDQLEKYLAKAGKATKQNVDGR